MSLSNLWRFACVCIAITGCAGETQTPQATGKGSVRAINAIPGSPQIIFLIEERQIGTVNYKDATVAQQWDDLEYNFNFEVLLPGEAERSRVATQFLDVVKDRDYALVLSGELSAPSVTVWESEVRSFGETDSVFEARFGHSAASLGPLDVYFGPSGSAPDPGTRVGTLAFGEILAPADYADGEYVLTYTMAGDPSDVQFTSVGFSPTLATSAIITVFDGDANDLGPMAVRLFDNSGASIRVPDATRPPRLRFINASVALGTSDIYSGEMLDTLLVADLAFGEVSASVDGLIGDNVLTFTPPQDTSVLLFEDTVAVSAGSQLDYFVVGLVDELRALEIFPDRRSVQTLVKLSVLHAASNHPSVDVYVVAADSPLAEASPVYFSVPPGNPPLRSSLAAGAYDLYVTSDDDLQTLIAGPFRLVVELGDVVELVVLDNLADTAIADFLVLPDP